MKPPFSYFGGKATMASWLAGLCPPHRVYVEPFAGSAAVLFAKRPSLHEVLNDADDAIVAFFRVLRERPAALARACRLTPYARSEFAAADLAAPVDELELARRWWVRVNQSFNHSGRPTNGWGVSSRGQRGEASTVAARIERFEACAARLATVTIENRDALAVIASYDAPDCVLYIDPPYLGITRSKDGGANYRHELAGATEHRALAGVLHAAAGTVIISGYPSELYDGELYDGWCRYTRRPVRGSRNRAASTTTATEVIWSNRPLQPSLFDHGILR